MKKLLCYLLIGSSLLLCAAAPPPLSQKDKEYSAVMYLNRAEASETVVVRIDLTPAPGWKWNADFPAKFVANETESFEVSTPEIHNLKERVTVYVEVTLTQKEPLPLNVIGTYSFCNDKTCKIFNRNFTFKL